jgi:hypothetical protein
MGCVAYLRARGIWENTVTEFWRDNLIEVATWKSEMRLEGENKMDLEK